MLPEFANEPYLDFTKPENVQMMREAIATLKSKADYEYELVIGGRRIKTKERFKSFNPSDKSPLGTFQ
ncbi:MAG: L-glutamate gamma-semialdehyde dehydrogenase, partial [bacterium]